jgi:hypothetical protein
MRLGVERHELVEFQVCIDVDYSHKTYLSRSHNVIHQLVGPYSSSAKVENVLTIIAINHVVTWINHRFYSRTDDCDILLIRVRMF